MTLRRTVIQSLALTSFLIAPAALAQNINPYPLDPDKAQEAEAPISDELTTIDPVQEERKEAPEPLIHLDDDYQQKPADLEASDHVPPPAPLSARISAPELQDGPVEMDVQADMPEEAPAQEAVIEERAEIEPVQIQQPEEAPTKNWSGPTWSAKSGENVRDVLTRWSDEAGVTLVWDSETGFEVPESVNYASTYEGAVRSLLAQYKGGEVRPYGVLNVEPNTGGRTLTIDAGPG